MAKSCFMLYFWIWNVLSSLEACFFLFKVPWRFNFVIYFLESLFLFNSIQLCFFSFVYVTKYIIEYITMIFEYLTSYFFDYISNMFFISKSMTNMSSISALIISNRGFIVFYISLFFNKMNSIKWMTIINIFLF